MIYIVRHGQTELNKRFALQGRSNLPLNDRGRSEAQKVADVFAAEGITIQRVFSSPLDRAIDTARIMAPDAPIITDDRLIEMDYGPYEGASLKEASPELLYFFQDFVNHPAPEGMEQLAEVVARTGEFIEGIKDLDGNTLISTHAIAMKGILEYLTPTSGGAYWSKNIGNCEVYSVECENGMLLVPRPFIRL